MKNKSEDIVTQFEELRKYALRLERDLGIVYSHVPPRFTGEIITKVYHLPVEDCRCVMEQYCPICQPAMFEKNLDILNEEMPI